MADRNTKFFQAAGTLRKRHNYIKKFMDKYGIWSEDRSSILQVFSHEFQRRVKKDPKNNVQMGIMLSIDILDEDNSWLTREITMKRDW